MTQDNTPPGPIFKTRLLRTQHDSNTNRHASESCLRDLPNDTLFDIDIDYDVEYRAWKIGQRGCVIV